MPLRLAFMGTPEFAVSALDATAANAARNHLRLYAAAAPERTRPDTGKIPCSQAGGKQRPGSAHAGDLAQSRSAGRVLCARYGRSHCGGLWCDFCPKRCLNAPRLGCFNLHASLLPRWRGAAPIQRAIMACDPKTGVMVMRMEEGLDTGPVLLTERVQIGHKTYGQLHDELKQIGAELIVSRAGGTGRRQHRGDAAVRSGRDLRQETRTFRRRASTGNYRRGCWIA